MKVKIISDSTCDLSPELIERYDIAITPLSVHCGDQVGHDGVEITPETIYDYVDASGQLPRTSAVNVFDYVREFRSWHQQGYSVVHFCISSDFSSSYQNACMAAADVGDVYVVDSRNLSTGQGLLVLHGAELAAAGHTAEEIQRACTDLAPRVEASFVIDRLDYLYKGGRCSALSAFGGNLLKLKPCIEVKDGKMTPGKKYRGPIDKVMLQYTQDRLQGRDDINRHRVFITHTRCAPEAVEAVRRAARLCRYEPYQEDRGTGLVRHVLVRHSRATGRVLVALVTAAPVLPGARAFVSKVRELCPRGAAPGCLALICSNPSRR